MSRHLVHVLLTGASMRTATVIVLLLLAPSAYGDGGDLHRRIQLTPRREAGLAAGFAPVLDRFTRAVRRRDVAGIMALLADDIESDDNTQIWPAVGPGAFREAWRLEDADSEFWAIAANLINGGSLVTGDCGARPPACSVELPSWMADYPADIERDAHLVVQGTNVPLRAAPSPTARVLARLSFDVVEYANDINPAEQRWAADWVRVQLWDGRRGYLPKNATYEADTGHRLVFALRDGAWRIVFFNSGD